MGRRAAISLDAFEVPVQRVAKPWGYELIYALTEQYCGRVLCVSAGSSLSLQYHERKDETVYLHSGRARIQMGGTKATIEAGRSFRIEPRVVHRLHAIEDSLFLEVSTPHLDDVVRVEDVYGRA